MVFRWMLCSCHIFHTPLFYLDDGRLVVLLRAWLFPIVLATYLLLSVTVPHLFLLFLHVLLLCFQRRRARCRVTSAFLHLFLIFSNLIAMLSTAEGSLSRDVCICPHPFFFSRRRKARLFASCVAVSNGLAVMTLDANCRKNMSLVTPTSNCTNNCESM